MDFIVMKLITIDLTEISIPYVMSEEQISLFGIIFMSSMEKIERKNHCQLVEHIFLDEFLSQITNVSACDRLNITQCQMKNCKRSKLYQFNGKPQIKPSKY